MKKQDNFDKFDSIVNNFVNGNVADYINALNKLSKYDLIRFTRFLSFQEYPYNLYCTIDNLIMLQSNKSN
jgi:hypothetical protein